MYLHIHVTASPEKEETNIIRLPASPAHSTPHLSVLSRCRNAVSTVLNNHSSYSLALYGVYLSTVEL